MELQDKDKMGERRTSTRSDPAEKPRLLRRPLQGAPEVAGRQGGHGKREENLPVASGDGVPVIV